MVDDNIYQMSHGEAD